MKEALLATDQAQPLCVLIEKEPLPPALEMEALVAERL
jgi:hypothetical protein